MFKDHIAAAIGSARPAALDEIYKAVSALLAKDQIPEDDASLAFGLIEARRDVFRDPQLAMPGFILPHQNRPPLPRSRFPAPKYQSARRHPERIKRRRQLAAAGPMPPQLAAHFTTGQLSVLAIVADEAGADGQCTLYLDVIAARAGVCRTTARNAIRLAAKEGLVSRAERPRPGQANLTTVLRVTSKEWRVWIQRGGRRAAGPRRALFNELRSEWTTGVKKPSRTDRLRQYRSGQPPNGTAKRPSGRPPAAGYASQGSSRLT